MWSLKKSNSETQRADCWLPGAGEWGTWGAIGQRVQTSRYKINKF